MLTHLLQLTSHRMLFIVRALVGTLWSSLSSSPTLLSDRTVGRGGGGDLCPSATSVRSVFFRLAGAGRKLHRLRRRPRPSPPDRRDTIFAAAILAAATRERGSAVRTLSIPTPFSPQSPPPLPATVTKPGRWQGARNDAELEENGSLIVVGPDEKPQDGADVASVVASAGDDLLRPDSGGDDVDPTAGGLFIDDVHRWMS